jgi:aubergine-like protein
MESIKTIDFLTKPKIKTEQLKYILNSKSVYANLYEIDIKKELKLYQYPFSVAPQITEGDIRMRDKLFKACSKKLKSIYGDCFISGDSLYAMKKIDEAKSVKCAIYLKGKTEYTLDFNKFENERKIKKEDIQKDPLSKQFIEMIIRDILHANPRLEFYKGFFVITDDKHKIETENVSVTFYPGFTTSFMETDSGNYLNVTLKNKIIQNETVLDYLNYYKYKNNENLQKEIKEELIGRSFKVSYAKRNYIINDILFDRSPKKQTFNYEGSTKNLIQYYEIAHKLKIKDENQPLILVRRTDSNGEPISLYFVPELCSLAGLDDEAVKDGKFMRELAKFTKFEPNDRVSKTNEFIKLLVDPTKDKKNPEKLSAKEKSDLYGIEVKPVKNLFTAYYMKDTKLIGGNNKEVHSNDRTFPVLKKSDLTNWLCFYEKSNYNDAENLYNTLSKASKAFGLKIAEPEWIEMPNKSNAKDWTDTADDYFGKNVKREFDFVVFLLGKNDKMYAQLKRHSLCKNGYVSQVVKARSIQKKGAMSVCSKILLQINAKLGGISYKSVMDKTVSERKLMVVGVDSSHIKGKMTGVAMVATINDSYTDFFNKETIIKEENNKEQLQYCVSTFIEEALTAYNKKNGEMPKGVVIYRQGVSLQQKDYLKTEIAQIDKACETKNVLYYYILVNTKTTFKFFEKTKSNNYSNPGSGLLVIDGVTNRNFFEFYIQPQEVTQGSATPTCFHVAYGNLDFPEMIAKFTFDLCHIYSNWQGTVRIPNVIKAAEKLSKMTAKYTKDELNPKLSIGQAYL